MQRYFLELAYNGAKYFGWQKQPEQVSVQETLEDALSTILGGIIEVTGCGRTDTGVHASRYFAHFDFGGIFPPTFLPRLNKFLPPDIAVYRLIPVAWDAHARYDATYRAYAYHLVFEKDPFHQQTVTPYTYPHPLNRTAMQAAAALLLEHQSFFPFCKAHGSAKTMVCQLFRSEWAFSTDGRRAVYQIAANRFLRGMVRLIVGMCLNVGRGKLELDQVSQALDRQERLPMNTSAPPEGLFLTEVRYPYVKDRGEDKRSASGQDADAEA